MKTAKYTDEQARGLLGGRGFVALEPYPGRLTAKWRVQHRACGHETWVELRCVLRLTGSGCQYCGWGKRTVRLGRGQGKSWAQMGLEDMEAAELMPLVPYPGATAPWPAVHLPCGREVAPRLQNLRAGCGPCRSCGRRRRNM